MPDLQTTIGDPDDVMNQDDLVLYGTADDLDALLYETGPSAQDPNAFLGEPDDSHYYDS